MYRLISNLSPNPNAFGSGDLPTYQLLAVVHMSLHGSLLRISRYRRTIFVCSINTTVLRSILSPPMNGFTVLLSPCAIRIKAIFSSRERPWNAMVPSRFQLSLTGNIPRFYLCTSQRSYLGSLSRLNPLLGKLKKIF